ILEEQISIYRENLKSIIKERRVDHTLDLLESTWHNIPMPVVLVSPAGVILTVNRGFEMKFGYSSGEVIGNNIELISPDILINLIFRILNEQGSYKFEADCFDIKNEPLVMEVRTSYLMGENEKNIVFIFNDMTARVNTEIALGNRTKELETLYKVIINLQEEERQKLARELHDEVGQSLSAILFYLEILKRKLSPQPDDILEILDKLKSNVKNTVDIAHNIQMTLRPSILDDLGLIPTIKWFFRERCSDCGFKLKLDINTEDIKLEKFLETNIYRIIQESMTNIIKHSRATEVSFRAELSGGYFIVEITDNGKGFNEINIIEKHKSGTGYGLVGMEERVKSMNGDIIISGDRKKGTSIYIKIPCKNSILR
ncbi:MAG: PAS domain S-box protein, partial [Actinomycetia bacterium]|nr:PAS domain S-box protein [Actinomycetes bacterium]